MEYVFFRRVTLKDWLSVADSGCAGINTSESRIGTHARQNRHSWPRLGDSVLFVGYDFRTGEGDPLLSRGDDVVLANLYQVVLSPAKVDPSLRLTTFALFWMTGSWL